MFHSFFTNIRHQDGIEALKSWLIENGTDIEKAELIRILAKLVLTSNCFTFNRKIYLQKRGMAMGTRMAPNYIHALNRATNLEECQIKT